MCVSLLGMVGYILYIYVHIYKQLLYVQIYIVNVYYLYIYILYTLS